MKFSFRTISIVLLLFQVLSCAEQDSTVKVTVINNLDVDRVNETIEIETVELEGLTSYFDTKNIVVEDLSSGKIMMSQWLDSIDKDTPGKLLFQTNITASSKKDFLIRKLKTTDSLPTSVKMAYSRFVPERIDDYTWENDRVAFRTYGPEAQRLVDDNEPGGTISSGMDAWLKRVDYPIIDKWYKNMATDSYHVDSGEGYDPYHVGASRGIGGIGVWAKDSLYTSKNFVSYKTIAIGPIRTVFELDYEPWNANGITINEKKRISLDLGSNLSRFESTVTSDKKIPNVIVGITLHENTGETKADGQKGYFRYWEAIDDSELGLGVVMAPEYIKGNKKHLADYKDGSQLLIIGEPKNDQIVYYAGFGWIKSGQFSTKKEWDSYLENKAKCLQSPLQIDIK